MQLRAPLATSLSVLVLTLPGLLVACGGGDGGKSVALEEWVEELCDIAADFERASDDAGTDFEDADLEDPEAARDALLSSLDKQRDVQNDFRSDFGKLGKPDIDGSDDVLKAFEDEFDRNEEIVDDLEQAIEDMDDDDDLFEVFFEFAGEVEQGQFRDRLEELADDNDDVQDLVDAIQDDEDCADTIFQGPGSGAGDDQDTPATPTAGRTPQSGNITPATEDWVGGICTAFSDWVLSIERENGEFEADLEGATTAGEMKTLLVDFLAVAQEETRILERDVRALDAPDVNRGDRIQEIFEETAGNLVDVFDDLIAEANGISTASPAQTRADVDALVESITLAFDEASAGFDELDTIDAPEIDRLIETRPECVALN